MGRRHQGPRPKSLTLIWLLENHPWAVQADWLRDWHERLDLKRTTLREAWGMCKESLKDHAHSHMYAAIAAMSYLPTDSEQVAWMLSQNPKRRSTPPWNKPMPWDADGTAPKARIHDRQLRDRLNERLGIS